MGVLKKKIKKYNKYVVEIEEDELQASNLENIEDIVIVSKKQYENELQKSKEVETKLESMSLEVRLKDLKMQEKDLEIQKAISKKDEVEESYKSKLMAFENKHASETDELKHLIKIREIEIDEMKKDNSKIKFRLEKENESLLSKIEDEENLKKQVELYKISTVGLKNDIKTKEEELGKIKLTYENILKIKSGQEKEIEELKVELNRLKNVKMEYNKLINNYRHLQEVANKKDEDIIELEAKVRKLDHYLLMSMEAINNLKNLGLFNRLLNRVPEGIDELEEDIKKLQPPKEVEIEPVRVSKPSDILGEKEAE
jgi:chromosome segregation ATPase